MPLQNLDLRWADVLEIRPFPAVVTGAHVKNLREAPDSDAARDFVGGYLGFDVRSRFALQESLASLASKSHGGAFWLNGAYGSGKSHLLGLLALLCDGAQSEVFNAQFPEFRGFTTQFSPRLTLFVALDDYPAARWSLEEVFWREAQNEWARQDLGDWPATIESARQGSRAEAFAALNSELEARERRGIAVFWDEISLFLGGREHRALQNDAAFLQFLGQLSARAPLWIWAALQKTVEDLGGLEPYSLGQIRDRFTLLPLSLAHLPAIVEKRLIEVVNPEQLEEICEKTFAKLEENSPKLGFGPQEWRALAPFHPHTVELLEAVTGRFFSRTRSAMLFCARAFDPNQSVEKRIGAEAIWDYFAPEIAAHPDLRPLEEPWNCWRDWLETLPDAREKADLNKIARFVLLCRVAGRAVTPLGAASALDLSPNGADGVQWARFLLEKLRRGAGFLALERGEDALGDRYALDLGRRVGETARRHILAAAQTLETPDERIGQAALRATKNGWALDELGEEGRVQSVFWRHSARRIRVVLAGQSPHHLANSVAATRAPGASECAILLLGAPFESDFEWQNVASSLSQPRLKAAFWHWKPRPATRDEWELAREAAGAHLATLDPILLDNRRGRAVLEHIGREQPARDAALGRVVARLFCEGELVLGNGAAIEAAELAGGEDFTARLESVADFALPQVFARFERIAPRARLLVPSNAETLGLELLRRPRDEPFFAPSLERLARNLGEPLGVAKPSGGRWKMAPGDEELTAQIAQIVGEGATFSSLEAQMATSDWGLTSEGLEIVICAQLRAGELVAFDARGLELAPAKIGLPLRRSVHHLKQGRLPESALWTRLASFGHQILEIAPGAAGFEQSAKIGAALMVWRDETQSWLELARSRVAQLRRAWNQNAAQWSRFEAASAEIADALSQIRGDGAQLLEATALLEAQKLADALKIARQTAQKLESHTGELLAGHALLTHFDLATPPELAAGRAQILERLAQGENALFDDDLRLKIQNWRTDYGARYAVWHGAQHDAARWNTLRRLENSDDLRVLERLATLTRRRFEAGPRLRALVEAENLKMCPRHDAAQIQLGAGEATCPSCGLRWGQRVSIGDPKTLESEIQSALETFRANLREPTVARFLERHNAPFLEWDGAAPTLWPLLTNAGLAQLDEAFAPRRRVARSFSELKTAMQGETTRGEIQGAFLAWLDGGEALENDDEVEISN